MVQPLRFRVCGRKAVPRRQAIYASAYPDDIVTSENVAITDLGNVPKHGRPATINGKDHGALLYCTQSAKPAS